MVFQNADAVVKDDLVPTEQDVVNEDDLVIVLVVVPAEVSARRGSVAFVLVDVVTLNW